MRYILGLVPSKQCMIAYIQATQTAFSSINDGYLLAENSSIPHVTICAFQCNDEEKISKIWKDVQSWNVETCPIHMLGVQLKKGEIPSYHYSVGLSVKRNVELLYLSPVIEQLISMPLEPFRLVLAKSDDIGQCIEILFEM